jgi:hypothetical protein
MLLTLLAMELVLAVFLLGVLIIAIVSTTRHGDPNAMYKLYAVRDGLIGASVFGGVPRDNAWLNALYENVNSILTHSNLLSGPQGWPLAVVAGEYQASHPNSGKELLPLPVDAEQCPAPVRALGTDLREALEHLSRNHVGLYLHKSSREREAHCIQRQKAKDLLQMIKTRQHCLA